MLLAAHYLFAISRHEGCHALVALAFGGEILDVHLWPPTTRNLAWISVWPTVPRSPASLRLQAALPYLVALALLWFSLYWLADGSSGARFLRFNVWLGGVVLPLAELSGGLLGYFLGRGDWRMALGPPTPMLLLVLSGWMAVFVALALWLARKRRSR